MLKKETFQKKYKNKIKLKEKCQDMKVIANKDNNKTPMELILQY